MKPHIRFLFTLQFAGFLLLSFPLAAQPGESNNTRQASDFARDQGKFNFQQLAASIKPSVVVIESVDRVGREGGRGTGFVVSENGMIATNFHVIGEHRDFKVRFADGKSFRPTSIASIDRAQDLVLFTIDANKL